MPTKPKIAPTAEQIDQTLRAIAGARNVNTKVDAMKKGDSPTFRKVLEYSYNPYIRFGVKLGESDKLYLISASTRGGLDIDEPDVWHLLDQFRTSTISSATKIKHLQALAPRLDPQTTTILCGIIQKSVVNGISASTCNKAFPGLIPVFSVQLAAKYADKKVKSFPQYVEVKYDGVRATGVLHATGEVEVLTRTGRPIPAATWFNDELKLIGKAYAEVVDKAAGRKYTGCVTDGELCGENFNDAVSTFRKDAPATSGTYKLFDILPMEVLTTDGYVTEPFEVRRQILANVMLKANTYAPLTKVLRSASYVANSREEIWAMYYKVRETGGEGVIVKDPNGLWERKRSNAWTKIKAEETADLRIVGAFEGEGEKQGTLGGLFVEGTVDGVTIKSKVGSGFTDIVGDHLWGMFLRDLERHEQGRDDFELIGNIAEVQFQEVTPDGSLRHPVFLRMRLDKDEVNF